MFEKAIKTGGLSDVNLTLFIPEGLHVLWHLYSLSPMIMVNPGKWLCV